MKSQLIVTGICMTLIGGGYVSASGGPDQGTDEGSMMMEHGSMMNDQGMTQDEGKEGESKAVEVGNKICPVSGDKVPSPSEKSAMGEVVKYEYNGKIYNFCCKMCIKDFMKDPEKFSKKAEEQAAQEKAGTGGTGHEEHGH